MAITQTGKDYVLFADTTPEAEPTWKIVMCQRGLTINDPKDVIDGSSKCGKKNLVEDGQATVEFDALLLQNDPADSVRMTTFEWAQLADSNASRRFKAAPRTATVDDVGKIIFEFEGTITNTTTTMNDGEMATVASTISVDGKIDKDEFSLTT